MPSMPRREHEKEITEIVPSQFLQAVKPSRIDTHARTLSGGSDYTLSRSKASILDCPSIAATGPHLVDGPSPRSSG